MLPRRLHNLEVAVRHLQERKTTKIVTDQPRATPPLSPASGWTFIAVPVGQGDPAKYAARATRLHALFVGRGAPESMDSAWARCSVVAYAAKLAPYVIPHPQELEVLHWDAELEERLRFLYSL